MTARTRTVLLLTALILGALLFSCHPARCATVSVVVSRCGLPSFLFFSAALMVDLAPLRRGFFMRASPRGVQPMMRLPR